MHNRKHAIVRIPPNSMSDGITTQAELPNINLARKQHQAYIHTLEKLGISVTQLSPDEAFPDSHFVEDAAIIHNQVAIMTRPGAKARRHEVEKLKPELQKLLPVVDLGGDENAIVDGGDVLFMGSHVFIGISHRTNTAGAECLKQRLHEIDSTLTVHFIPFDGVLHLKSGITALNDTTLLGNPLMTLSQPLPAGDIVWVPAAESYAANALIVNDAALIFAECTQTLAIAEKAGLQAIPMDMSEFRKMDGSFTCLSLLW